MFRTVGSNHRVSHLFIRHNRRGPTIGELVSVTHRGNTIVGRISSGGLSFVYNKNIRRNITLSTTTRRCSAIRSVLGGTTRGGRGPFVVVYSNMRSARGLNTMVEATSTTNTRNIVVPGHHDTSLGFAINGASTNTLRCIPITEITGLTSAVSRLGRGGV